MMFLSMVYVYVYVFNTKKVSYWNPDMRVPKFLLPDPKKIGFWAPKRPNMAQKCQPEIGISDHGWPIWCPVDGFAGGCGAGAVSRKTPIYFIYIYFIFILI